MAKTKNDPNFLLELLGNTTRVRILRFLVNNTTPITRHALALEVGAGNGPIYEQVLAFRALGIVREEDGKIALDPDFVFINELRELVQSVGMYLQDPQEVLERIDALLGDDYYISGYLAARQHGAAIDYDADSILVAVLDKGRAAHATRLLAALSAATPVKLTWMLVDTIPREIARKHIYGCDIWIASVERGILDSIKQRDFPAWANLTLFLQNLLDGNIKKERLVAIAQELGIWDRTCLIVQTFNKGAKRVLLPLTAQERGLAGRTADKETVESAKGALNSVLGG
jgi:hypothetical protein